MAAPSQDDSRDVNGETLERRVRRLEDAVAAIQDTHLMEDRVVERVAHRVEHLSYSQSSGLIVGAARMLLPKTIDAIPENGTAAANGTASTAEPQPAWSMLIIFQEFRWILRMLTDYRYRMSWTGRAVLVVAIIACILSWFLLSGLWFIGGIIDRIVLILAAVITYKAMTREVARYQELMARLYRR